MHSARYDAVLVGGGLHNAMIALALLEARPGSRLAIVERDSRLAGEHTWCFHEGDLPAAARPFVEELVEHRWDGYDVHFPGASRHLPSAYAGFSSRRLRERLAVRFAAAEGCSILLEADAVDVGADYVELADGRRLQGDLIVDARGPQSVPAPRGSGYQIFVGQELQLRRPHGLERPILMDARVPQRGGYRFVYVLPLAADRLLVEDTRFSDAPALDREDLRREIAAYCASQDWDVASVVREEEGVLPMPWTGANPRPVSGPLRAGYAGGWMHPATGYSFPVAVRLAELTGRLGPTATFGPELRAFARSHGTQLRFARLLNRLLFRWFRPADRVHVFQRFYRLPEDRIRRFYALQTTMTDRIRLLVGRPPRGFSLRARLQPVRRTDELALI